MPTNKLPLTTRIKDYADICAELKVDPDKKIKIEVEGFDENEIETLANIARWMRVCKVANQGGIPKRGQPRYYPYYEFSSGAGLVFDDSTYDADHATTGSAARLCIMDKKICDDFGVKFKSIMEKVISL